MRGVWVHELSIAMAVIDSVKAAAQQVGATRVLRVRLRIGELSAVDPDALQFAYAAVTGELPLFAGSELEVEWVPIRVHCTDCGQEAPARPHSVACALCGSLLTRVVAGEELDIANVEVERDGDPSGDREEGALPQR